MPLEGIANLPAGAHLFLDANIFIYAFLGHSSQCRNLLGRCASEQVFGITSFEVVNEVTHRLMVAEALGTGVIKRDRVRDLRGKRCEIAELTEYWAQTSDLWFEYTCFAVRRGSIVPCSERPIAVRASYQRLSDLGGNGRKWR